MQALRIYIIFFLFLFHGALGCFAQSGSELPPEIVFLNAVKLNRLPLGSGARALGMGGAFTAVADDATAVSWNPAGLTNLEKPEFSAVGSFIMTKADAKDFTLTDSAGSFDYSFHGDKDYGRFDLNFIGLSYPFIILDRFCVASLSYHQIYDFHSQWEYQISVSQESSPGRESFIEFESSGGVGAVSPALAFLITPKLSFGFAINFFRNEFFKGYAWKEEFDIDVDIEEPKSSVSAKETKTFKDFEAVNVTIGLLWDIWEKENNRVSLGLSFNTPYTASLVRDRKLTIVGVDQDDWSQTSLDIDFPASATIGLAVQLSRSVTVAFDVTWTDWSEWILKEEGGARMRPLGFNVSGDERVDDTVSVRAGLEYLIFRDKIIFPVRAGLFYDPRPSLGNPTDAMGLSLGFGATTDRYSLDCAYQLNYAPNVDLEDIGISGGEANIMDHKFFTSIIIRF